MDRRLDLLEIFVDEIDDGYVLLNGECINNRSGQLPTGIVLKETHQFGIERGRLLRALQLDE